MYVILLFCFPVFLQCNFNSVGTLMLLAACLCASSSQNVSVTVCDCNESAHVGAISFADDNCAKGATPHVKQITSYSIYTTKPEGEDIQGNMCSRWIKTITTSTNFINEHLSIPDHFTIDTTFEECTTLKARKSCNGNAMHYKNAKWQYANDPIPTFSWMRTNVNSELNCLLEEVT